MSLTKILAEIEVEVALLKWKREILKALLDEGRVSQSAFNVLNNMMSEIETAALNLRERVDEIKRFWENMVSEKTRILESLLVDLRFRSLIGEMDELSWLSMSAAIELGIDPINAHTNRKNIKDNANLRANASSKRRQSNIDSSPGRKNKALNEREKRFSDSPPEPNSLDSSHCMNPWKPDCRRTDIKLSIYYEGRFLPICNECWKEIAERNIEWTN